MGATDTSYQGALEIRHRLVFTTLKGAKRRQRCSKSSKSAKTERAAFTWRCCRESAVQIVSCCVFFMRMRNLFCSSC